MTTTVCLALLTGCATWRTLPATEHALVVGLLSKQLTPGQMIAQTVPVDIKRRRQRVVARYEISQEVFSMTIPMKTECAYESGEWHVASHGTDWPWAWRFLGLVGDD